MVRGYYHRPPPPAEMQPTDIASGSEMWRMDGVLPYSDALQDLSNSFPLRRPMAAATWCRRRATWSLHAWAVLRQVAVPTLFGEMIEQSRAASFPGTRMRETGAGLFQSSYARPRRLRPPGQHPRLRHRHAARAQSGPDNRHDQQCRVRPPDVLLGEWSASGGRSGDRHHHGQLSPLAITSRNQLDRPFGRSSVLTASL